MGGVHDKCFFKYDVYNAPTKCWNLKKSSVCKHLCLVLNASEFILFRLSISNVLAK